MLSIRSGFTFGAIVDVIYGLPFEERLELKNLLEHNIIEDRRGEIYKNGKEAKKAERGGELVFSENIEALKEML
jgi:hypothetical protein